MGGLVRKTVGGTVSVQCSHIRCNICLRSQVVKACARQVSMPAKNQTWFCERGPNLLAYPKVTSFLDSPQRVIALTCNY